MNSRDSFVWTPAHIAILRRLWEEGKTAAEIAARLGQGASRNSVIGKAHRLGLRKRPSPIQRLDVREIAAKGHHQPFPTRHKTRVNAKGFGWTEENLATLRTLWAEDKRPAEIAAHFGNKLSAQAVSEKACVIGLPSRKHRFSQWRKTQLPPDLRPARPRDPTRAERLSNIFSHALPIARVFFDETQTFPLPEPANNFAGKPLPLYDLGPGQCRFAVTPHQAALHLFCGEPIRPGSRYCTAHHAVVYVPRSEARCEEKAA